MGFTYAWGWDVYGCGFLAGKLSAGNVVFDLGANRGQMSLFFSLLVGENGEVVSFEPMNAMIDIARRNAESNKCSNISFHNFAIGEKNGQMNFLFSDDATTQGKLEDVEQTYIAEESAATIVVQTRSLDSLLEENLIPSPDFMKIDVEGAAASVFEGAARILDEIGPSIYIELHGPEERDAVNTTLRQHGYRIYDVQGKLVDDLISGWASPLWCVKDSKSRDSLVVDL